MQHDYNIGSGDSKTGLQVRQDINNALAAIKSSNSGGVAPTSPTVGMLWHNSITDVSYKYTATGWKAIADEDSVDNIVAPYTVAAASSASASAASAASSLASSQLATSSANFKGNWSSAATYLLGESVLYNGIYYRAVIGSTNQTPLNNTTYWAVAIPINLGNFMMSKAEFNAVAAERRANRAGSGFDEFGKHYITGSYYINQGLWVGGTTAASYLRMGMNIAPYDGTSKTTMPYVNINGVLSKISDINVANQNDITLPPAPTVLPYTATLTQQQIDSGVIKHADASNSGLIVNGKFDTDTSGWIASNAALTVDTGRLKVTQVGITANGFGEQIINTVVGKRYVIECTLISGSINTPYISIRGSGMPSDILTISTLGYGKYEFVADASTTRIMTRLAGTITDGGYSFFDNIAVFPADAISRSDLVFLESWHEDVSEKDFVYPLGNVQYLGTTGDSGTPVAGAFAGSATYSLFSDTWQADSALVGKGYVWSTLSDANKKAFVANPENNCYLDGDKVIQVRYRMRVVQGWGDSWTGVDPQINAYFLGVPAITGSSSFIKPKGKLVATNDLGPADSTGLFGTSASAWTSLLSWCGTGHFVAADTSGDTNGFTAGSYNGQVFALPIALVHRRNQGAYHPVYNENGTMAHAYNGGVIPYWNMTVSNNVNSIANCFGEIYYAGYTGYCRVGGNIGYTYQSSANTRADDLRYDQIHEGDITDLRMSSKVPTDYNRLIDKEFNRLVAGTYRGTEGEWVTTRHLQTSTATTAYVHCTNTNIVVGDTVQFFVENDATKYRVIVSSIDAFGFSYTPANTFSRVINTYVIVSTKSSRAKSNTLTHTDIIGSPANYPTSWKQSGVSGTPLIVAEDGTSLLPTGTTGSDGLAAYKLSRKANATPLQVLKSTDSGVTWIALTVTTHYTFSTTTNAITFTAGNIPLTADLIRVTYQTHTNMAVAAVNSEVLAIGDALVNAYSGFSASVYSLIGKVGTVDFSNNGMGSSKLISVGVNTTLNTGTNVKPSHSTLAPAVTTSPTVKAFPYLTRSNGKAYLQLVFKEMKYGSYAVPTVVTAASATYTQNMTYKVNIAGCALDGKVIQWLGATATFAADWSLYDVSPTGVIYLLSTGQVNTSVRLYDGDSWGDDSKFNIVDYVSTTTDTNGVTVLIGQKRVELPYFIGAAE